MEILAGAIDKDDITGQLMTVNRSVIHPDYDAEYTKNDVCLLILNSNLTYNSNVKNIALNTQDLPANTKCVVSGWGNLHVSYKVFRSRLK